MSDAHDEHQGKSRKGYNTLGNLALGGAVAGGAAIAVATFVSGWSNGKARKRKFTDWFPKAIDDSAQGFKQAFTALSSPSPDLEHSNETSRATQMNPMNPVPAPKSGGAEGEIMTVGYAYGANAERQQWFIAQWHETSGSHVRVEYLSTMDGEKSSLMLPSPKKSTIPKKFVRVDAPSNAFESPGGV
jgi:hypothetical protein